MSRAWIALIAAASLAVAGCGAKAADQVKAQTPQGPNASADRLKTTGVAAKIVEGAKLQCDPPAHYDASYRSIPYPNGDVASDRGACTDVVIRALRHAGYDLQKLIHEDIKKHLADYPKHGERPDPNIDQRRVPNQR